MGQTQSTTTPTTPKDWTTEQVKQATGLSKITAADTRALNKLSPSQKRELLATIHKQNKMTDDAIKAILKDAKAKAKAEKAAVPKKPKALSSKQKADIAALPPVQAAKAEAKIAKVLAKEVKTKQKTVKKEINKEKTYCAKWEAHKKTHPSNPKNPLSGRPLSSTNRTYKVVNAVCHQKKKVCAKPGNSPLTGKPLKPTSREAIIVKELCAASKTKKA